MTATLEAAFRKLMRAYVNMMENGRDRIVSLGGTCDPVDVMEGDDPYLREARAALASLSADGEGKAPRYRILRHGETIKAGDQPLNDDCETWGELSGWEVGMKVNALVLKPIRRRECAHDEGSTT